MQDWRAVKRGDLKAAQLRREKINAHAVVMRALGGIGRALLEAHPNDWREKLAALRSIDWRKSVGSEVNPMWDNVCITAGSVVSNRQARAQTLAVLKRELGLSLGAREEKPVKATNRPLSQAAIK